jgi:hypothetical protein
MEAFIGLALFRLWTKEGESGSLMVLPRACYLLFYLLATRFDAKWSRFDRPGALGPQSSVLLAIHSRRRILCTTNVAFLALAQRFFMELKRRQHFASFWLLTPRFQIIRLVAARPR